MQADRILTLCAAAMTVLGALAVTGLMVLTMVAVICRYWLNNPIFGIGDLSVLTLVLVAAGAVVWGARNGAHVSGDPITGLGPRIGRVADITMNMLSTGICGLASYALFRQACGIEKICITENLSVEHAPFYQLLGVAMALLAAHHALALWRAIRGA